MPEFAIERWSDPAQVPAITRLLHAAYAPLAEAGMRYLAEVLPDGAWSRVLALVAVSLIAGGAAWILGKIARRGSSGESSERAGTGP